LWEQAPEVKEVTSQATARTMMQLLKQVTRSGTGASAAQLKHPIGGKTGTTSDFTDAWFLGFSPSVTCGVWVGFDSRQSLGEKMQGARVALPIWIDFMREAIKGKDDEQFAGDAEPSPAEIAKADAAKLATGRTLPPAAQTPILPTATPPAKPLVSPAAGVKGQTPAVAKPVYPPSVPVNSSSASKPVVRPAIPAQPQAQTVPKPAAKIAPKRTISWMASRQRPKQRNPFIL
jgi:penicillin-binding protein 1A